MKSSFSSMHELIDTVLRVRFSDLEKERESCEALLELAQQYNLDYAKAFAYTYLGDYYLAYNDTINSGDNLCKARQLCSEDVYPTLYMKACHLSGFHYELLNDEQNSLQYYLQAISLAEKLEDMFQVCNAWNNIANMFQNHHQFEEAKRYYLKAYQAMNEKQFSDQRLRIILLFNLAEAHGRTGQLDEMKRYLDICRSMKVNDLNGFHTFICKIGHFLYEAFQENTIEAYYIAEDILQETFYGMKDHYIIIENVILVIQCLIQLNNKHLAKRFFEALQASCGIDELQCKRAYIELKVQYAEAFCTQDELHRCCREYYIAMKKLDQIEDDVRVSGMNTKIHLFDIMNEHEIIKKENERLEDKVHIDELTGLYNRRYFNQLIEDDDQMHNGFGILMIDVDYFKQYNDSYGHIHGDVVLREIGDILNAHASESFKPCRYGGDEFVCVYKGTRNEDIIDYIKHVRKDVVQLKREHKFSNCSDQITLSIGYQFVEYAKIIDGNEVLAQADKALYVAKSDGRNTYRFYESIKSK